MWNAKYNKIDNEGLQQEIIVNVKYFNDDGREYQKNYTILPENIDSSEFKSLVQNQLDILNSKDTKVINTDTFLDKNVFAK